MYIYIYIYIYVCMYVCMYVYIYIYILCYIIYNALHLGVGAGIRSGRQLDADALEGLDCVKERYDLPLLEPGGFRVQGWVFRFTNRPKIRKYVVWETRKPERLDCVQDRWNLSLLKPGGFRAKGSVLRSTRRQNTSLWKSHAFSNAVRGESQPGRRGTLSPAPEIENPKTDFRFQKTDFRFT